MMNPQFHTILVVSRAIWFVVALLGLASPTKFFQVLGYGRGNLPQTWVLPFRVLAALNAVGTLYLLIIRR